LASSLASRAGHPTTSGPLWEIGTAMPLTKPERNAAAGPPAWCPVRLLCEAADSARRAGAHARLQDDGLQSARLDRLACELDYEAMYTFNRNHGLPIVRRRTDAPDDATIGWYYSYDAPTQAQRQRLGLGTPDPETAG
jgi:hypothetical protein